MTYRFSFIPIAMCCFMELCNNSRWHKHNEHTIMRYEWAFEYHVEHIIPLIRTTVAVYEDRTTPNTTTPCYAKTQQDALPY